MTAMMDKTTTEPTVTTFTVNGKGALIGMLADLALTAEKGKAALEALTVIRLHTEGGRLHGWSTDRHRAAHAVVNTDGGELPHAVRIAADDVENLVKTFRQAPTITVTVSTGEMSAEFAGLGVTLAVKLRPVSSHDLGDLLPRIAVDTLPESAAHVTFRAEYLADFAKIGKRRKENVRVIAGATGNRPSHIWIGPDYRAWLMPMRVEDGADGWLPSVF